MSDEDIPISTSRVVRVYMGITHLQSCSSLIGLGFGLNILVLFPSLCSNTADASTQVYW